MNADPSISYCFDDDSILSKVVLGWSYNQDVTLACFDIDQVKWFFAKGDKEREHLQIETWQELSMRMGKIAL